MDAEASFQIRQCGLVMEVTSSEGSRPAQERIQMSRSSPSSHCLFPSFSQRTDLSHEPGWDPFFSIAFTIFAPQIASLVAPESCRQLYKLQKQQTSESPSSDHIFFFCQICTFFSVAPNTRTLGLLGQPQALHTDVCSWRLFFVSPKPTGPVSLLPTGLRSHFINNHSEA